MWQVPVTRVYLIAFAMLWGLSWRLARHRSDSHGKLHRDLPLSPVLRANLPRFGAGAIADPQARWFHQDRDKNVPQGVPLGIHPGDCRLCRCMDADEASRTKEK